MMSDDKSGLMKFSPQKRVMSKSASYHQEP